jgi:hypothetical protein
MQFVSAFVWLYTVCKLVVLIIFFGRIKLLVLNFF